MCPVWLRCAPLEKSRISVGENSLGLFWVVLCRARLGLAALACVLLCLGRLLARAGLGWAGLGMTCPGRWG